MRWNIEKIIEAAKSCNNISDFKQKYSGGYSYVIDNNLRYLFIDIFGKNRKGINYWNNETITAEALKYVTKKEFYNKSESAYNAANKLKIIDVVCSHMNQSAGDNRCIYAYEFSDNFVYVGLTNNLKKRDNNRKRNPKDAVIIHINETQLLPPINSIN